MLPIFHLPSSTMFYLRFFKSHLESSRAEIAVRSGSISFRCLLAAAGWRIRHKLSRSRKYITNLIASRAQKPMGEGAEGRKKCAQRKSVEKVLAKADSLRRGSICSGHSLESRGCLERPVSQWACASAGVLYSLEVIMPSGDSTEDISDKIISSEA